MHAEQWLNFQLAAAIPIPSGLGFVSRMPLSTTISCYFLKAITFDLVSCKTLFFLC